MELEQRLGLYQVFLKLYEHHRDLLDEILKLENTAHKPSRSISPRYVQGVIQDQQISLVTNLLDGSTQRLLQHQNIWIIGRSRQIAALPILEKRLSRQHAAIQYVEHQGFYLVDLDSTNGSFVNGEPVYRRQLLQDGDRIRLGSLSFSFFLCQEMKTVAEVPAELLNYFAVPSASLTSDEVETAFTSPKMKLDQSQLVNDTSLFLMNSGNSKVSLDLPGVMSEQEQAEILDRFFNRQGSQHPHRSTRSLSSD